MEIKRIQQLADMAKKETERNEILDTTEVFSGTFRALLHQTQRFLVDENLNDRVSLEKAVGAMKKLHQYGEKYGMEFPEPENERDAALYVVKFGSEIVRQ